MKFYATIEPCRKLKNAFTNLSSFYIIDVDSILEKTGLDITKSSHQYLINIELKRLIATGAKSKRYIGIIYINSLMNEHSIESIKSSLDEVSGSTVDEVVVIDDYDVPKLKHLYKLVDEVMFFPTLKRTKIIECSPTFDQNNKPINNETVK